MKKALIILLLFSGTYLLACTCFQPRLKKSYIGADLIFVGKVIEGPNYEDGKYLFGYKFETLNIYKGRNTDTVTIYTGGGMGDCGFVFDEGQQYLVYAYKKDGVYKTDICTRTCLFKNSFVDLGFLNRLPGSLNSTSITGKVTYFVDNSIGLFDRPAFKNLSFTIKNADNNYLVNTDSNGTYYVEDIKPGLYNISINEDLNLAIKDKYSSEVEIKENDVYEYNFTLTNENIVSGEVKDHNNKPVNSGYIQLIPEQYFKDYKDKILYEIYDCWLYNDGKFIFKNIPNGKYYLGINMDNGPWDVNPFPKTFFPDADSLSSASVLNLTGGSYTNINLTVKKIYKEHKIKCKLITSAGEVWKDAYIYLKRKTKDNNWELISNGSMVNDKGESTITVLENIDAWIIVDLRNTGRYYGNGLHLKNPSPIKIDPNKHYDIIEIVIELVK